MVCSMCNGNQFVMAAGSYRPCPRCQGSGRVDTATKGCSQCGGSGTVTRKGLTGLLGLAWDGKESATCPRCGGRGLA